MNSRNHHMFSSFSHYLVTTVGGVDEISGDHVQLRPAAGGALDVAAARVSIDTARGRVLHAWRREGGAQCGKAAQGDDVELDCGASGGVIEEVRFASLGIPSGGGCRSVTAPFTAADSCHAPASETTVRRLCLGRRACVVSASAALFDFDQQSCEGHDPLALWVDVECSAKTSLHVDAEVPIGSSATLHLPARALELTRPLVESAGSGAITTSKASDGVLVAELGAGTHHFTLRDDDNRPSQLPQQPEPGAATPVNAQLYPCNASAPWTSRQKWNFAAPGPDTIALASGGGSLQLQIPSPNLATTCPAQLNASCWNLVVGPATSALRFALTDSKLKVAGGAAAVNGLCVADSNKGTASYSNGYLANVFLTECELAGTWTHSSTDGTLRTDGQCLDVGSAGSSGDLGFAFDLLPAAPPERQAFHSDEWVSWGGSVIQADEGYHMFAAVFNGGKGLSSWGSNSAIMHLQAGAPEGPFKPTQDGPKKDGVIVDAEAHNPTVVRANDGTYLLFSIGHSPLLASKGVSGPWSPIKFTSCNNPAPLVIPGRDEVYVYCHGGPDQGHWGSSVGMTWTPHWSSGVWHTANNNTDDIHGGGRDLFGHPVEDPFAWYAHSTNPLAPGSFHLLCHGFRMGMVNNSDDSPSRVGNAYGAYANAPTPFGPWSFQESRVAYSGHIELESGASLGSLQRRERPHLLLTAAGAPSHLYNGVCPADGYTQGASNSSGHCYTFVQRINVSDGSTVALKSDDSSSVLAPVDVTVYGSSGAACIAAIAAARSGAGSVLLLSQTNHVGGMLTGGLMHTDAANADVIQGFTREFFMRTTAYYEDMGVPANATRGGPGDSWLFESHVGERVLEEMMAEAHVTVVRSAGGVVSVTRSGTRIERVVFESGAPYSATVWIDASYEGAILERVATMVWGREGKDEYNETSAGRGEFQGITGSRRISPYWSESVDPYDTPSNIIPHVAPQRPAAVGAGDLWMEPYDFRLCFTNSPSNRMAFTKPASYNASEWEFWRRVYVLEPPKTLSQAGLNCVSHIPNNFSDCGQKACLKCDMLGMNHGVKC